jgi:hypothetical protein
MKIIYFIFLLISTDLFGQDWVRSGNNISTKYLTDTVRIGPIPEGESFPRYPQVNGLLRVGGPVVIINEAANDQLLMGDTVPYTSKPNGWFKKAGTIAFMSRLDSTSYAQGVVAGIRWYQEDTVGTSRQNGIMGRLVFCTQSRVPGQISINQFPLIYSGTHLMLGNNMGPTGAMTLSTVAVRGTYPNIDDPFEVTDINRANYYQKVFKSGNIVFGTNKDNKVGKVQIHGKLTIDTLAVGSVTDSIMVIHNGEVRKIVNTCGNMITELINQVENLQAQVKELQSINLLSKK